MPVVPKTLKGTLDYTRAKSVQTNLTDGKEVATSLAVQLLPEAIEKIGEEAPVPPTRRFVHCQKSRNLASTVASFFGSVFRPSVVAGIVRRTCSLSASAVSNLLAKPSHAPSDGSTIKCSNLVRINTKAAKQESVLQSVDDDTVAKVRLVTVIRLF